MPRSRHSLCRAALLHLAVLPVLLATVAVSRAEASGFEKAVLWSGRFAGLGGAGTAAATGADALFFNPAGLAQSNGTELAVNFSPMFAQLEGGFPTGSANQRVAGYSARKGTPIGGALGSYALSSRWGAGIGYYAAGGIQAYFEGIDYTSIVPTARLRPTIKADLEISEMALGTGYEIAPNLKLGAAWRILNVAADFSSVKVTGANSFQNIHFTNLEDTVYSGMRLGAQFENPDKRWGIGASWRSSVDFDATGAVSAQADVAGNIINVPASAASVKNTFPQQAAIGGYWAYAPRWTMFSELSWTEYSVDRKLDVTATLGGTSLNTAGDIPQDWSNMFIVRLGTEYQAPSDWAFRAGYVRTSRVTSPGHARSTFASPGTAHTFTLGYGRRLRPGMRLDTAVEYGFGSGTGSSTDANPLLSENIAKTNFRSNEFTAHTSLNWGF